MYQCPDHGGPSHEKREEMIRKKGLQGREVQIVVKKGDRPSAYKNTVCVVM